MGAQSGLASRLNVPGVSTTYITGAWTALSLALVDRLLRRRGTSRQRLPRHGVQLLVVTGYLAGALAGGYGDHAYHGAATALPSSYSPSSPPPPQLAPAVADPARAARENARAGGGQGRRSGRGTVSHETTALPADATAFDLRGAELSHHNGDCSFETILRHYELTDPVLWRIAEIIHEADLDDERYDVPEAPGLDVALRGCP